jgi:type II secretion system protein D
MARTVRTTALLVVLITSRGAVTAQSGGADAYHSFPVRYTAAAQLQQALQRLAPPGTEIRVDPQTNQILVRGPVSTLQMIQDAIQSMDRPAEAPRPLTVTTSTEPVLKNYPARFGDATAAAAWLREQFACAADLRIAADQRTAQILVLANPALQAQVGQRLEQFTGGGAAAAGPEGNSAAVPAAANVAQTVPLRFNTAMQVEAAMLRTLGPRMAPNRSLATGTANYIMAIPGGRPLEIAVRYQPAQVMIQGSGAAAESLVRLVQVLDAPNAAADESLQFVSLRNSKANDIRQAVAAIQSGPADSAAHPAERLAMLFKPEREAAGTAATPAGAGTATAPVAPAATAADKQQQAAQQAAPTGGLVGPVQVQMLDGLDVLVIRGHEHDVQHVMQVIQQIEQLSAETQPTIEVYQMQHVDCEEMGLLVGQVYPDAYVLRQGNVTITPLVKPNALLMVGRAENVHTMLDLIKRLDLPVPPDSMFRVFPLKHTAVSRIQFTVQDFFANRPGLGTRVRVTSDYRTNALIAQASPRDMEELAALIARLDVNETEAVNEVRIFKLENSLASDLALTLQGAITGQMSTQMGGVTGARPGVGGATGVGGVGAAGAQMGPLDQRSTMLKFLTVDPKGQRLVNSGLLSDVRVTPDPRSNSLVIAAPAESMDLIGALIKELDGRPAASAQIKVFTIMNADALSLANMLQALFGQTAAQSGYNQGIGGAGGRGGFGSATNNQGMAPRPLTPSTQTASGEGETSLIPVRLAVDVRSNSIIASGSMGDLSVVEAILLRLDEGDLRNRKSIVYRLKNSPASNVAQSVNSFLQSELQMQQQIAPGLVSAYELIEQQVVVVPEVVTNSLIVSATPRYYDEVRALVEQLDKRPPMVMIQVLIAQVTLNDFDEFGIELGLQDSLLFDRGVIGGLTSTTTQNNVTSTTTSAQTLTPGFNWNNQNLGNINAANSADPASMAAQSLTNFAVGRTNSTLGYGGLVLSASSQSVSVLMRALRDCKRAEVLSRPQIMTLDNQPAFILVGQKVPLISSTQVSQVTVVQNNQVTYQNVGIILGVTPRISPDGIVVMQIDAENSDVSSTTGIPISIAANGQVITQPIIDTTTAQTTVSAADGQTVVLGGLITKSKAVENRRVPYLSDIPVIGNLLFSYNSNTTTRTELLIIMTPHIVLNDDNVETLKQVEASRMSWCLADVEKLCGNVGLRNRGDHWSDTDTTVIYPDGHQDTAIPGKKHSDPEAVPLPPGAPSPATKPDMQPMPPQPVPGPDAPLPNRPLQIPSGDESHNPPQANPAGVVPAGYEPTTSPSYVR